MKLGCIFIPLSNYIYIYIIFILFIYILYIYIIYIYILFIYLGNSHGGIHFQWSSRFAVLVGVGSFVGVSQSFYLPIVWTTVFWGIALSDCFIILSTLFIFNLHGRKALWRALLAGGFLINIWYCISFSLNINSALVI